jgi:hypothetical protein
VVELQRMLKGIKYELFTVKIVTKAVNYFFLLKFCEKKYRNYFKDTLSIQYTVINLALPIFIVLKNFSYAYYYHHILSIVVIIKIKYFKIGCLVIELTHYLVFLLK